MAGPPSSSCLSAETFWVFTNTSSKSILISRTAGGQLGRASQALSCEVLINEWSKVDSSSPMYGSISESTIQLEALTGLVIGWEALQNSNQVLKGEAPPRMDGPEIVEKPSDMLCHVMI
jgi:hypothetical protein